MHCDLSGPHNGVHNQTKGEQMEPTKNPMYQLVMSMATEIAKKVVESDAFQKKMWAYDYASESYVDECIDNLRGEIESPDLVSMLDNGYYDCSSRYYLLRMLTRALELEDTDDFKEALMEVME